MSPTRREVGAAVLLCLLGSLLLLVAVGRGWAEPSVAGDALRPVSTVEVAGSDLTPGVRALGLVGLAGVVAVAATRGRGRVLVGVVLVATGVWAVVEVARALGDLDRRALSVDVAVEAGARAPVDGTPWPLLCLAGAALVAVAGALVAVRGRRWAALSARYEPPAPGASTPPPAATDHASPTGTGADGAGDAALWSDLDRGIDPTR